MCGLNDGAGPYVAGSFVKEECVNHVSKRMRTQLRQVKENERVPQKTKKGKTVMYSGFAERCGLTFVDINQIFAQYR